MNLSRHRRALKATIEDIKHFVKVTLILAGGFGIFFLFIVLCIDYPIVGVPLLFITFFLALYYCNLKGE